MTTTEANMTQTKTSKLIDITDCTDKVLDVFLAVKGGAFSVPAEHLTVTERRQLAALLEWPNDARTAAWCSGATADTDTDTAGAGNHDYEGAILDRQDAYCGEYPPIGSGSASGNLSGCSA
jgi:hypothetical protein